MLVKNRNPGLERISTCLLFFSRFSSDISSGGGLTEYFFESNTFSIRRFSDDLFDHWEAYLTDPFTFSKLWLHVTETDIIIHV